MNKTRMRYFEQEDVLYLVISEEPESRSLELSRDITVELRARLKIPNYCASLREHDEPALSS
jgi:hypothetical protein